MRNRTRSDVQDRSILPDHHCVAPEEGPEAYKTFRDKKDGRIKAVIKPNG